MPASVTATKAAPQMIRGGEHQPAVRGQIKIFGKKLRGVRAGDSLFERNVRHASAAEAGAVSRVRRHAGEEFVRDAHRRAPARTLVNRRRAKLTVVRFATQGAATRSHSRRGGRQIDFSRVDYGVADRVRGRRQMVARALRTDFFHCPGVHGVNRFFRERSSQR